MSMVTDYPCVSCKTLVVTVKREGEKHHVRCPACGETDVLVPNRPTKLGRLAGAELARLADATEAALRPRFPSMRERCASCAFRAGTVPNGCEETVIDAVDAVVTGRRFMCHMHQDSNGALTEVCAGWLMSQQEAT